MAERIFSIETHDPLEIFGAQDINLKAIKTVFPEIKLIVRGEVFKAIGDEESLQAFANFFDVLLMHYEKFGSLRPADIEALSQEREQDYIKADGEGGDSVLVHSANGKLIKAKTANQRRLVEASTKHNLVFAIGPAGSGKTYTAVALAVRALKNKEVKRIILARPAVEAGENLGFLPGDMKEKLDPYMMPLYDALRDMIPAVKLEKYMQDGTIQIAPLAFMRGRTLNNAFAILDEAQNATSSQLKMFLTRMGIHSKFIITGDVTQIDLPKAQISGLMQAPKILENVKGISFIYLNETDIIRHRLVSRIVNAYKRLEK